MSFQYFKQGDMMVCKKRLNNELNLEIANGASVLRGYYTDENTFIITSLYTHEGYRSRGYATALLRRAVYEARRNKVDSIHLDDCSGADFFRKWNNIYVLNGFTYDEEGFPEMTFKL